MTTASVMKELKNIASYRYSLIFHQSMTDNNATDTTEYRQRKQVHSKNGMRSPSLIGSNKDKREVGKGNQPKGVSEKRKRERSATKHKKQKNRTKTSSQRVRVAAEVLLYPLRQKNFLPLQKDINLEEPNASQTLIFFILFIVTSSSEFSETRNIEGTLGSKFQVIPEEDKSRYNPPTLAKLLSARLQFKWLWDRISLLSLKLQISCLFRARSCLIFRQLQSVDSV